MTVVVVMRRQETTRSISSSSRRDNRVPVTPDQSHHVNAIGCMAGIFQLVSKYHTRRKFLTFGRKHETQVVTPPTKKAKRKIESQAPPPASNTHPPPQTINSTPNSNSNKNNNAEPLESRRLSSEVERSSPIPAAIRRSTTFSPPDPKSPSPRALMVRLMGLDDIPAVPAPETVTAAEKRRKLLGALEKCDEDLKALRRIIEAVRDGDRRMSPPRTPPRAVRGGQSAAGSGERRRKGREVKKESGGEQPSPVSVLEAFPASPPSSGAGESHKHRYGRSSKHQEPLQHRQRRKNPAVPVPDKNPSSHFLTRSTVVSKPLPYHETVRLNAPRTTRSSMVDTVEEVCRDVAWGHNREIVKLGLRIQDDIYKNLIDEIVRDLRVDDLYCSSSLPFVSCKKRLFF